MWKIKGDVKLTFFTFTVGKIKFLQLLREGKKVTFGRIKV